MKIALEHPQNFLRKIEDFDNDLFKQYRSSRAKYIVGISMDLTYVVENTPTHHISSYNPKTTVNYLYDLELDENFKIIGGEWYQNAHPDFLWNAAKDSKATCFVDYYLSNLVWRDNYVLSNSQIKIINYGSQQGLISNAVLDFLVELSK